MSEKKCILIVDDEEIIHTTIIRRIIINKMPYDILKAVDGNEALDFMKVKNVGQKKGSLEK